MGFKLDDYEPVADRIERFWNDHPAGRILTDLIHRDDQRFIVKATVYKGGEVEWESATGYAEEIIGSTNVNRTSALENCETSAIGRALANLGYAVKNRASREEMVKAQPESRPRSGGRKLTPSPQSSESHEKGTTNGVPVEQAAGVARMKTELLNRVGGDKALAMDIWAGALRFFALSPTEPIPADMLDPLEAHLKLETAQP